MSILAPGAYEELLELGKAPGYQTLWNIDTRIFVNGEAASVLNTVSIVSSFLFSSQYYGYRFLTIMVDPLVHRLMLNNLDSITIEITKRQAFDNVKVDTEIYTYSRMFRAQLTNAMNRDLMAIERGGATSGHIAQLGVSDTVVLQFFEPFLEDYRLREISTVYRKSTLAGILKTALGGPIPKTASPQVLAAEDYNGLRGVTVHPPDNDTLYEQLPIPPKRLVDLPRFLQETHGLYACGVGSHIYNGIYYIFPILRYTDFQEAERTVTIVNIPVTEIPYMDKTFMYRSKQLFIFSTGDTIHLDASEEVAQNIGTGVRFTLASDLMANTHVNSNNKATFDHDKLVKEYSINQRPSGLHNTKMLDRVFTDNPFPALSTMAEGLGTKLILHWDRADPKLLYPGMQIRVLYRRGIETNQIFGTLVSLTVFEAPGTDAIMDNHYVTSCDLTIHIRRMQDA